MTYRFSQIKKCGPAVGGPIIVAVHALDASLEFRGGQRGQLLSGHSGCGRTQVGQVVTGQGRCWIKHREKCIVTKIIKF